MRYTFKENEELKNENDILKKNFVDLISLVLQYQLLKIVEM